MCIDVDSEECLLGGYTTADSLTNRGSEKKAITIIIEDAQLDIESAFIFDTTEFSSFEKCTASNHGSYGTLNIAPIAQKALITENPMKLVLSEDTGRTY